MSILVKLSLIAGGGAIGTLIRFGALELALATGPGRIIASTFAVNALGSFLMGILLGVGARRLGISPEIMAALTLGVLGGMTTFSTFSAEAGLLVGGGRFWSAVLYAIGSAVVGIGLFMGGLHIGKTL